VKHLLFAIAVLQFIWLAASSLHAQAPAAQAAPSLAIASIKVSGAQKFPSDQIIAASGLKTGDVVTAAQIQEAADRLSALGIFSSANFHYTAKGTAINLEFQVQEAATYPIVFDNFPWLKAEDTAAAIRSRVGLFTGEAPGDGAIIEMMSAVIEDLLAEKNVKGSMTHQLISAPSGDGMVMQFRLEGVTLRVQLVEFGDAAAANSERLKDRVSDIKGQPFSLFAAEIFENEQIRPLYAAKGFLRAQIGPPQARLIPDANDPKQSAVDLSIPIAPGAVYSWKGISWQGNASVSAVTLDALTDLKPGDVANGLKIALLWQTTEAEYGRRGYLDMKLTPEPQYDDATHLISYRSTVIEGPQYHMGQMIVTGLSLEAEKRLRQAWQTAPGQIFDDGYYESHVKMLSKPSRDIFGDLPVHYNELGHLLRPDTDHHTVDVLLDFK
jgi:outer membrane protein insertion porin family